MKVNEENYTTIFSGRIECIFNRMRRTDEWRYGKHINESYDEIVLYVNKIGENSKKDVKLTEIQAAPDKYTRYIADYVGRNLAACGYTSMAGDRRAKYGGSNIKFVIVTEDGSLVDVGDAEVLKQYVVTNQNIAPNTELNLSYMKDSNGNEHINLAESKNIEEIELYVKKLS